MRKIIVALTFMLTVGFALPVLANAATGYAAANGSSYRAAAGGGGH